MNRSAFKTLGILLLTTSNICYSEEPALTLNDIVSSALQDSKLTKSWNSLEAASESDFKSANAILSPTLKAEAYTSRNTSVGIGKKPSELGQSQAITGTVTFPFSTGTTFELSTSHDQSVGKDIYGNSNAALWEAKLSQSLLRNSFGASNSLRTNIAEINLKISKLEVLQDRQNVIFSLENAYWDLLEAKHELRIFEKNISRRTSLENWVKKRMGQFAAEQQDLLQIQTLLAQSKLGYISVKDSIDTNISKIKKIAPNLESLNADNVSKDLDLDRNQYELIAYKSTGPVVAISTLLTRLKSDLASLQTSIVEDSLRPELSPYISYGTSGVDKDISPAWKNTGSGKNYTTKLGITLSMDLDGNIKSDKLAAARLRAESQKLLSEISSSESKVEWEEILRRKKTLQAQLEQAKKLYAIQNKKVIAERKRFEQGRTTALQMTTFELDESDSELKIYQLLSSIRKTEALARAYTHEGV